MNKGITISDFQKGIAPSALFDLEKISNMDIVSTPGAVKQGFMLDQNSISQTTYTIASVDTTAETVTATVNYTEAAIHLQGVVFTGDSLPAGITADTLYWANYKDANEIYLYDTYYNATQAGATGKVNITGTGSGTFVNVTPGKIISFAPTSSAGGSGYAMDENGRVWYFQTNYTPVLGYEISTSPLGVAYYKGHVLAFGNSKIYGCTGYGSSFQTWTDMTISEGSLTIYFDYHYSLLASDDCLYITNGEYVGKISQETGKVFSSADNTTYAIDLYALDLPASERSTCLSEMAGNLLIGTLSGNIYQWDKSSTSFEMPFTVGEPYIWRIINRNNKLYVFAGNTGSIYISNTINSEKVAQIPERFTGYKTMASGSVGSIKVIDAILLDNEIIFSQEHTGLDYLSEVWSLGVDNALTLKNTYSKTQSGTYIIYGGGLMKLGTNKYMCSWKCSDGTSGIDANYDTNHRVATSSDTYKPNFISALYSVGDAYNAFTFRDAEIQLTDKLVSGNNINLYYRENLNDSWTQIGSTVTYTTHGAVNTINLPFAPTVRSIQIKCEYYGGQATTEFNPGIKSIILR